MSWIIAVDNGGSGTICAMDRLTGEVKAENYIRTPSFKEQNMLAKEQQITRVSLDGLVNFFSFFKHDSARVYAERPFMNPMNPITSANAARAFEVLLIATEDAGLSMFFPAVDPKTWQKAMFPEGYAPKRVTKNEILERCVKLEAELSAKDPGKGYDKAALYKKAAAQLKKENKPKKTTKQWSTEIGIRLFPHLEAKIRDFNDADSLLMAEWARRFA